MLHAQGMSDLQLMQFVQRELKTGSSQAQIATKLMQRGVTMQQLQRVRKQYEQLNGTSSVRSSGTSTDLLAADSRMRENNGDIRTDENGRALYTQAVSTRGVGSEFGDDMTSSSDRGMVYIPDTMDLTINGKTVFGRDIFNKKALSFEPNMNIATPERYLVGPGDVVFVDVYGASQRSEQLEVTPDGTIVVSGYGPIHIAGLTVKEANAKIKRQLGARYSSSKVRMTVGQTRTIVVNVFGEVVVPGTYTLSAFASVFHALYMAGGVNRIGTLRNIKVFRGGKLLTVVDVYDYLLNGHLEGNIRLADNDVIVVDAYDCIVDVTGSVKRPMAYEMRKTESLASLIDFAGGFTGDAYTKRVRVNRVSGSKYSVYNVNEFDMANFKMADKDSVSISTNIPRYENLVEVRGGVFRPGQYSLGNGISTVKELIESADGLTEDAFAEHAVLQRMKEDRTRKAISVDVQGILDGTVPDIPLENEDILLIALQQDKMNERTVSITGEVQFPDTYEYAEGETIEDLILWAGGLTDAASTAKVDVSRRIIDPKATSFTKEIAKTYSFTIKDGFIVDGEKGFTLMPYDEVTVRRSPGYVIQRNIRVEGEVLFEGAYTLSTKNQRLSDIIKACGGVTDEAYVHGARLERRVTEDERFRMARMLQMAQMQASSGLDENKILTDSLVYYVGIELDKALANPGSDYDIVLREGDRLVVPEYNGTVKINGNVMYPNTVAYTAGKNYKWYINEAGGYGYRAKRSKAYILYQNGKVSKAKNGKVEPGCEIIVPTKTQTTGDIIAQFAAVGTSLATIVTMIATVTNLIK